jgi:hypothetical protein
MSKKELGLLDLLKTCGFDAGVPSKLVRHESSDYDMQELPRSGWVEAYQGAQRRRVFDGIEYLVSFVGAGGTLARLVGVYRVLGRQPAETAKALADCPYADWRARGRHFYTLEQQPGFESLEGRVIIDWGKATRSWHQKLRDKPVVEVRPKGEVLPTFRDYLEFELTYSELKALVDDPGGSVDWAARLSAVAGIYLIVATTTGEQYVGSAHGASGIWGRWTEYAKNGHGGNKMLKELIAHDKAYPAAFRYSILHVLPTSQTRAEVLQWESVHKRKLGTRAVGLNLN